MSAPLNLPAPAAPPSPELLFSSDPAPAAPAPAAADPMLEERNADSVLFKLDQIAPTATSPQPLDRLAAPGPANAKGGSGLIDIKSLMAEPAPADGQDPAKDIPLSAHLDSSTSMVAAQSSLVGEVQPHSSASQSVAFSHTPPAAKRGPLIVLCLLAAGALAAAIAAVMIRGV